MEQGRINLTDTVPGQGTFVIDGNGNRSELRYDGHGRQDRWTFPSTTGPPSYNDATQAAALASAGSVNAADYEAYSYDPNGNRTSLRKRDTSMLHYEYDALNRLTFKEVPPRGDLTAAQTRDVFYSYDLRGLQLSARFDSQSGEGVTNAWDGFGRLASSSIDISGVTRTLTYQHDLNGNRTRITHPDGTFFRTLYDGINRPYYLDANLTATIAFTYFYPHGAPSILDRPNIAPTYFNYDGVQRVSRIVHTYAGWVGNADWTWTRNPAGQIAALSRDNDAYAWTGAYAVTRPYTANGLNQYTAAGSANFAYDANGNLVSDGTNSYLYDVENRLVGGPNETALVYDPLGRIFRYAVDAANATFLYDGDALVAEYGGGTTLSWRYAHNVGADVPMIAYQGADLTSPRWLHADHQGSIVAHSNAAGATAAINTYDEYGIPGAANTGRFQYTGQIWLPELGMYHYKARIYSPTLGRFMQTDPVGYEGGINLYAYVGNDPVNNVDPTGRWSQEVHQMIFRNVLRGRVNNAQMQLVFDQSYNQDRYAPGSQNLAAHFLRAPGQNAAHARQEYVRYVRREMTLARYHHVLGNRREALVHFTNAAHSVTDSFSPVHRDANGDPAVYRSNVPTGSIIPPNPYQDALMQGHSPHDWAGYEGSGALRREGTQGEIEGRLSRMRDAVFGPTPISCTGSRITC